MIKCRLNKHSKLESKKYDYKGYNTKFRLKFNFVNKLRKKRIQTKSETERSKKM